ncbi:MAG: Murein hydrolase activator EnvC [Gammaproteobacteria bacterium]|nr:Murein hydrolase activator EnvC [Gammaproteobacteria bacterium]
MHLRVRNAGALLVLLCFALPALPQENPGRAELDELRSRIKETVTEKKRLKADAAQALNDLRKQELELAAASKQLATLRARMKERQARLQQLIAEGERGSATLDGERASLARVVRSHYAAGREQALRLILGQDEPARVTRVLAYHEYFVRARLQRVAASASKLRNTAIIAENTRLETEKLLSLESEQTATIAEIERLRAERRQTLAALNEQISDRDDALNSLRSSKRELEKLLYSLPAESSAAAGTQPALNGLRGRVPWPTTGKIVNNFTAADAKASGLRHHGVYIEAAAGSPVRAIGAGRVRFADWFQGFGLLIIIDHGQGYLSLYGHNQSLSTKAGATVIAGEQIASVGDSGGQRASGLYFGIRHNGEPVDPAKWCR